MRSPVVLLRVASCLCLSLFSSLAISASVSGQLNKWQPLDIDFQGPLLDESSASPNPFLDYRLTVTFTSPSGRTTDVPGFFAGDGNGGGRGQVWRARFAADEVGRWSYRAQLRSGTEVAISLDDNAGSSASLEGASGQFDIQSISGSAEGFLRLGRLEYVGKHYMKFRDGPYWIKGGTDSPENLLGFAGIDGTVDQGGNESGFLHNFNEHRGDWNTGDPLFSNSSSGVDSRGLIGALNYLGEQGVNSVYFLPMNLGGDGQETYPFTGASRSRFDNTHYDISKLHQWNEVLAHAQRQGVALNIVLSETEPANEQWLDNGALGVERKLFFRELIARFGYLLAVKWNLGEENDYPLVELQKHADYIRALDWSDKPIAVHTHINQFFRYGELVGDSRFSASSIQYDPQFAGQFVEQWRANSANAGHPWVLDMDENTNGLGSEGENERRKEILYDVFFSGGNIEWYFGSQPLPLGGDTTAGNFRLREAMWRQMRIAREMMERELPFWEMEPADSLVSGDSSAFGGAEVFALQGETYAVYLPQTNGGETINLSGTNALFRQRWFDPRTGEMFNGASNLASSGSLRLGSPPSRMGDDWVVLLTRSGSSSDNTPENSEPDNSTGGFDNNDAPQFTAVPSPTINVGTAYSITLIATDTDGTFPVVTVGDVPGGMRVEGLGNGQLKLDWTPSRTGVFEVELIARDALDNSRISEQSMTITVSSNNTSNPGNDDDSPVDNGNTGADDVPRGTLGFNNLPSPQVQRGELFRLSLQAVDGSGLAPSVTVGNVPGGMRVNGPGNGVLELEWLVSDRAAASSVVELIAIDPLNGSNRVTQRLVIRVVDSINDDNDSGNASDNNSDGNNTPSESTANAPVIRNVEPQRVRVGQTLSIRIKADDEDGIPPALLVLDRPNGASFSDSGDGSRTFIWTPSDADIGRLVLTFVARDHEQPSLTDTINVEVQVER